MQKVVDLTRIVSQPSEPSETLLAQAKWMYVTFGVKLIRLRITIIDTLGHFSYNGLTLMPVCLSYYIRRNMWWKYLPIPQIQRLHCLSLEMEK